MGMIMERYPIIVDLVIFFMGNFVTLVACYVKIFTDISYIKGQLSEITKQGHEISGITDKYVKLEQDFARTAIELERGLKQIKFIEYKVLQNIGGIYGSSS